MKESRDIDPDEIFLDSRNLPAFDIHQFEGRLEKPISKRTIFLLALFFLAVGGGFVWRIWSLQVVHGGVNLAQSENNRLGHNLIFPKRGLIYDRNGIELAWNVESGSQEGDSLESVDTETFSLRRYIEKPGFAHVLGYVDYPKKDTAGFYYQESSIGIDGIEEFYSERLIGQNGVAITETNVAGEILSEAVIRSPEHGESVNLALDARVQEEFYNSIARLADDVEFFGGAGVIMDVITGELIALVSYPEYNSQVLTDGADAERIESYITDDTNPFLNRAVSGLYAPGSAIKPFIALGALHEGVITPERQIYSSGSIEIPNPYNPRLTSVFNDWKAHGWVNMRDALAVSSNVYFFEIGGGFEDQEGIGIAGIEKYTSLFGIDERSGIDIGGEAVGIIPSPEWKEEVFSGDPWRLGDTYNTAIGQYGFQVTPLAMARGIAAIANGGLMVSPHLRIDERAGADSKVRIDEKYFQVVREGMRQGVRAGTAQGLDLFNIDVAAKTGTAEVGISKKRVNSWVVGFFPYENPRYAFATVMERGPRANLIGATFVMRGLFEWMALNTPEYLR